MHKSHHATNSKIYIYVSINQADGGHGYKEFLEAVEEVETVPAALCSEKEVWAKYNIDSDTISVFRKVHVFFTLLFLFIM